MKSVRLLFLFVLAATAAFAQKGKLIKVPLTADKWTFAPGKVEFGPEKGVLAMKILPGAGKVVAKDFDFANGTIEFDYQPINPVFAFFYFRFKDATESECFYFRTGYAGNPLAGDAVQYMPIIKGTSFWDMLAHYQTNATFTRDNWNHVKLVVNGSQLRVYVNSPTRPTLEVERMEGNTTNGTFAFDGEALVANLVVKPGETEGLLPTPGSDPTAYDPRYIRSWAVSEPIQTPAKVDFSYDFLPSPTTNWQVVEAERRGLVNLTRNFGKSNGRRLAWLKVKIKSATAQKKKVDLGFSDEVWVFVNGKLAYLDKNLYAQPTMKEPKGRISTENTSFELPLKEGDNEVLVGLANDFFGWGLIARLEDLEGLQIAPDPTFDSRMVKLSDQVIDIYTGKYVHPNGVNFTVTREPNALRVSGEGMPTQILYPLAENRFFLKEMDLQMEFVKDAADKVTNLVVYENGKQVVDLKRAN
jgi:hypothetical protein